MTETDIAPSPRPLQPINRTLHWVLWSLLALVIAGLLIGFVRQQWISMERRSFTKLDHFKTVPDFALTERSGQPFDSASLKGKIWLADFFFTACPGPCLVMNGRLQGVQEALRKAGQDVRIVSFSISPERDTPAVLTQYAKRFDAKPGQWFFLTGERSRIYDVARNGFMLAVVPEDPNEANKAGIDAASQDLQKTQPVAASPRNDPQFVHSTKIALVDRQGVVRGYYDSTNPEVVQQMLTDIGNLLREQPRT